MLPAQNVPARVSPPCPIPVASSRLSTALRAFSPWGLFNSTCSFPVPVLVQLPLLFLRCLPIPHPVLSHLPFPLPIFPSLPCPDSFLTALRVLLLLLTPAIIIDIAIARTALSTMQHSGIRSVLIHIMLVDYLIPIQLSNCQEVAWFVLLAA